MIADIEDHRTCSSTIISTSTRVANTICTLLHRTRRTVAAVYHERTVIIVCNRSKYSSESRFLDPDLYIKMLIAPAIETKTFGCVREHFCASAPIARTIRFAIAILDCIPVNKPCVPCISDQRLNLQVLSLLVSNQASSN